REVRSLLMQLESRWSQAVLLIMVSQDLKDISFLLPQLLVHTHMNLTLLLQNCTFDAKAHQTLMSYW
ncbi:hypothetical protein MKW92_031962, partial [Papaver armeniacum]